MKRVVITGPTGSIGTALIERLIEQNVKVIAICRKKSKRIEHIPNSSLVTIIECNVDNLLSLKDKINLKCDVFYHFAWAGTFGEGRNDVYLQNQNVKYTLDAVELAHELGCSKFVGAGSQAEYGRVEDDLNADTPAFPENGYGIAKLCAGQMSRLKCSQLEMEHVWARILSVYGPRDGEYTMIMSTINKLLNGHIPDLTEGNQMWDFLYSKDAAEAFYLLGKKGKNAKTYCLGSGKVRPLKEYILILRNAINENLSLGLGNIPYGDRQVMYLCADIRELAKDTGFAPCYDFEDGIRKTIEWCKEERKHEKN